MRLGANAGLLHQMQAAENAGCSWLSERCCANVARRAECSAFRQSEMRLSANAVFSLLSERCCANGALQGGVQRFQAVRNAAGCECGFAAPNASG